MGFTASGGIYLDPDSSPYTGTTLTVDVSGPTVADGTHYTAAYVNPWGQDDAHGIDTGSTRTVTKLVVYCCGFGEGATPINWATNGGDFSVFGSDVLSSWTAIDTFSDPTMDHKGAGELKFTLTFTSAETYQYFKVVATGSAGVEVTTSGSNEQGFPGEIEYEGDIVCSTGTTEINGVAANINAADSVEYGTGTAEINGVAANINAGARIQASTATVTISGQQAAVWEKHHFDINIIVPVPTIEATIQQEPEINIDITVPAAKVEGIIDCFDINAAITVPSPVVVVDIAHSVEINADIIVSMPSVTAGIVLGNDINIDIAAPAPTIEVSIAISSDIDADIIVSMPLVRAEITNSSDPSIILKHSRY